MALDFRDLDPDLRVLMVSDFDSFPRYPSAQIPPERHVEWEEILREALEFHDDEWLTQRVLDLDLLMDRSRPDKNGKTKQINKPSSAKMLAEGQFNSYYTRAVCVRAANSGVQSVSIYRAKRSDEPRPRSLELEGQSLDAVSLLDALRAHDFPRIDEVFGMPLPNSGLSVTLKP